MSEQRNDSISLPGLCFGYSKRVGVDIDIAINTIKLAWERLGCGMFILEDGIIRASSAYDFDLMSDFVTSGTKNNLRLCHHNDDITCFNDCKKIHILLHDSAALIETALYLSARDDCLCTDILKEAIKYDLAPKPVEIMPPKNAHTDINFISDLYSGVEKSTTDSTLKKLADTITDKYWSNADPKDKDTWESQEDIIRWAMEKHGLSKRKAEAVEIVSRPDFAR